MPGREPTASTTVPPFVLRQRPTLAKRAVTYFLSGLFAVLPLVITVAIVLWVADFIRRAIGPHTVVGRVLGSLGSFASSETLAYLLGWIIVLAVIFAIGVAMEAGARRFMQRTMDGLLGRLPVLGSVYHTSKQVVDMLDKKKEQADLKGMSPVFCFFGKDRGAAVLALLVSADDYLIDGRSYKIVIVPTAPVPIGGGLLFLPSESVAPANLSAEGLMSIYVSMGASASSFLPHAPPNVVAAAGNLTA